MVSPRFGYKRTALDRSLPAAPTPRTACSPKSIPGRPRTSRGQCGPAQSWPWASCSTGRLVSRLASASSLVCRLHKIQRVAEKCPFARVALPHCRNQCGHHFAAILCHAISPRARRPCPTLRPPLSTNRSLWPSRCLWRFLAGLNLSRGDAHRLRHLRRGDLLPVQQYSSTPSSSRAAGSRPIPPRSSALHLASHRAHADVAALPRLACPC